MAKDGARGTGSAYAPRAERRSTAAELLARAARDPRHLLRDLLLGEAVAERPPPVRPAQGPRHPK